MAVQCPSCGVALPASEVAGGWCESCGKKLPASVTGPEQPQRRPAASAAAPPPREGGWTLNGAFWTLVFLVGGPALVVRGFRELSMLQRAGAEPADCDVAELEAGKPIPRTYVRLSRHVRLYPLTVYSALQAEAKKTDPEIQYALVPVMSEQNPAWVRRREGDGGEVQLGKLRVVIRTERFKKRSEIPPVPRTEGGVTGLVVSELDELRGEEAKLIRSSFPEADLKDVLVVKEGTAPYSLGWPVFEIAAGAGMTLVGGLLVLGAVAGVVRWARKQGAR